MNISKILAPGVFIAMTAGAASAVPVQWTSGSGANNHWYEVIFGTSRITWTDAASAAASMSHLGESGYLATVTSALEQTFLNSLNPNGANAWLGGSDAATEGTWTWITGETWSYSNWAGGEPNNFGNEDYLVGWWRGDLWNDLPNSWTSVGSYVVEYDNRMSPVPLPAGLPLALGAFGMLGFVSRRRRKSA